MKIMTDSVGVYLLHQNWRIDQPAHYVSISQARLMRKSGAWYSVNSGKDIAQAGQSQPKANEETEKSRWISLPSGLPKIGYVAVMQLLT